MTQPPDPIQITRSGITNGFGFSLVCSGYLVENGKVLLVHHKGFDKWVPPGGHIEAGETFAQTAAREFKEETGLDVEVVSSTPSLISDENATPEAGPFYVDIEREGFQFPSITQFFFVRRVSSATMTPQVEEINGVRWFASDELASLSTFKQVRAIAQYAIENHPDSIRSLTK